MAWLELSVDVDPEAAESVSEVLAQYGYNGGVVIDQPIIPSADGPDYTYDTSRPVTLRTYLPLDAQAEATRARIEQALWHLGHLRPVGPLRVQQLEEHDWAEAWKRYYTIQHIGARTVIVPSWLDYTPQPGEIVLRLDPGMAFGTGLHPTTQLCLVLLEEYVQPGMQVLDLGCGSGILAIAAARLGAGAVLALDTDPIAVAAARENVTRNGLDQVVYVAEGSLGAGTALGHWLYGTLNEEEGTSRQPKAALDRAAFSIDRFDLIVANIIAGVLVALAQDLARALAPGGLLIGSGIIAERAAEVAAAFETAGLAPLERRQDGDWVALVHRKPAL
jgi:ribosomal protein L11 methyltransferase